MMSPARMRRLRELQSSPKVLLLVPRHGIESMTPIRDFKSVQVACGAETSIR
jgi:hypothetical protein